VSSHPLRCHVAQSSTDPTPLLPVGEKTTSSSSDFPPLTGLRNLVARISSEWDYTLTGTLGETERQTWLDGLLDPFWDQHRTSTSTTASASKRHFALQELINGSMVLSVRPIQDREAFTCAKPMSGYGTDGPPYTSL
jgi:hypothetical protein